MSKPVAVVVGVGPGLGSALARRFAKAGMAVAVARRNPERLAELAEEIEKRHLRKDGMINWAGGTV